MIKEYDYFFKLVIVGNAGVGKSSLLRRYSDDKFTDSYLSTIGVEFRFKTLEFDGHKVKLQIWDTAGQEKFRTITNAYYKGADGIIMVYDISSTESFEDIDKFWINQVESYAEKNVELLLLGNKSDVEDKDVTTQKAQDYAASNRMAHMEVSAKTADQVSKAFISMVKTMIAKKDSQRQKGQGPQRSQQIPGQKIGQQKNYNKKEKDKCC
ncbi:unnamed protein product [Paramecium pentaurelia]|uniref:Uncharacterized protein n=1 Tax=Paramecium pentaurelia TaxID=43138 RepID=A0A8S1XX49_9CILI|nr:unnamed protein product [Paramecium pentaurelia]